MGFTLLTLLATYPLAREAQRALPNDVGDPVLNAWILAWDADRIRHGLSGLWDAPNFYPHTGTLTYSENLLGIAVFTAPLQWLSNNPVLVYNIAFLFSYVLAGTGMYLLTLWLTGNRAGAVVAGVAFAFLPFRMAHWSHLQVLMSGWMPVGLYALHRYFETRSRPALLGFVAAFLLQSLSNGYFMYFFAVPVIVVATTELVRRRWAWRTFLPELTVGALLVLLVLAPVGLAYFDTHAQQGLTRSRDAIVLMSADLASYGQVTPALSVWGDLLESGPAERELFPGFMLLGLAVVGAACGLSRSGYPSEHTAPRYRYAALLYTGIAVVALILSLGPEPNVFGQVLMTSGPYDWLLAIVPGLDGLRVAARMAVVVYLALAVLASIGVAALTRPLTTRAMVTVALVLGGFSFAEGFAPMRLARFDPGSDVDRRAASAWLSDAPEGAVLELPLGDGFQFTLYNVRYQFDTLEHGHPVVNGFSGYTSRILQYLGPPSTPLHELNNLRTLLEGLRSLGVRYLVVNESLYGNRSDARAFMSAVRRHPRQLVTTEQFGLVTVFQLTEWDAPEISDTDNLISLPHSTYRVHTSHREEWWPRTHDGDRRTRWLSGVRQHGEEWIEVVFDRPRDVGLLRFGLGDRSLHDYPRRLVIETLNEQGEVQKVLYRGGVIPQLLKGLVTDHQWTDVDVLLPSNETRRLRIRQTAQVRPWYWSINEFSVWVRPPQSPDTAF